MEVETEFEDIMIIEAITGHAQVLILAPSYPEHSQDLT